MEDIMNVGDKWVVRVWYNGVAMWLVNTTE